MMRRRVWAPSDANPADNRAPEPQGSQTPSAPPLPDVFIRDEIEVRPVRAVGLGRHVWIAKVQPWEQKHPIWMAVASRDQMIDWWGRAPNPRTPPPFGKQSRRLDKYR
jgi:hypothetical protein